MTSITRYIHQKMKDQLKINTIVAQEPFGPGGQVGWHLSISHPDRYPTYDEIKKARYDLVPDTVTMAMLFPPSIQFVNVHPNCFHLFQLFQLFDEQVPDLFRAERRSPAHEDYEDEIPRGPEISPEFREQMLKARKSLKSGYKSIE